MPKASGLGHLRACMSEAEGRPSPGMRDRPRPEVETSFLCKDDPAKVSHAGRREDMPLMHTAWTGFTD
eukprot:355054-Chlamydomonas_euryale.AAC.1